jgi:hypothetical protein
LRMESSRYAGRFSPRFQAQPVLRRVRAAIWPFQNAIAI